MKEIIIGTKVERIAKDYTGGRKGEVIEVKDGRARVKWTADKNGAAMNLRTWVRFQDLKIIDLFDEYRLYFNSEDVYSCFARNTDHAIEQLAEFVGEGFMFSDISEIKISVPEKGWQDVPLPAAKEKHHIAEYNGKSVVMDYIENPKDEFKFACMRIIDNGADGTVICPDGKRYEVTQKSKKAKLIKSES